MRLNLMPVDVAEVFRAGDKAHLGHMRLRGVEEVKEDGQGNPHRNAGFNAKGQGGRDGGGDGGEVAARIGPGAAQGAEINQAKDGDDDRGGQRGLRQKVKQRRQRDGSHGKANGGKGPGGRGFGPGVGIDDRPRKAPGDRQTTGEGRADIGRSQAQQLLIRVDPLAFARGEGLGDRHAFDKADDRDQGRGDQQRRDQRQVRHSEGRQALRHLTHDAHALFGQTQAPDQRGGGGDGKDRTGLGQDVGGALAKAKRQKGRLHPLAHPEQKGDRPRPKGQRDRVGIAQMRPEGVQNLGQGVAPGLHAQQMPQLPRRDQDARGGDEPGNHRMAEEIRQKPQLQRAHRKQHRARQKRQRQCGHGIARRPRLGHLTHGGGGHQRHHGHRPHGQHAAGAEDRIKHDRQDRGVDPRFGRQARQQGIGQRLRHQHDRHDQRGHQVGGQGGTGIAPPPVKDRQAAGHGLEHGTSVKGRVGTTRRLRIIRLWRQPFRAWPATRGP